MQSRIAFNGGEFSPEMSSRSDMDKYPMGCDVLENWEVGQFGGVKRRRGMQYVCAALEGNSKLVPYIYSYKEGGDYRFLVEIGETELRVLSSDGLEVARFTSGKGSLQFALTPREVRYYQLNKLLILTSRWHEPMVLKYDGNKWEFEAWAFKHRPWRYTHLEPQESAITMTYDGEVFDVDFGDIADTESDKSVQGVDYLRVSYRTEREEVSERVETLIDGVTTVTHVPVAATKGDRFCTIEDDGVTYYVCIAEFDKDSYVEGLESPANYGNAFRVVDTVKGFEDVNPIFSLKELTDLGNIKKNTKIAFRSQYWKYWTCVKDFECPDGATESGFDEHPEYFVAGMPVGKSVPCKGKWAFKSSGIWYGSYEVRRCYEGDDIAQEWESRGASVSYNDAAVNSGLEGDESEEECYLRLFITRSRRLGDEIEPGFPADSNHIKLVVDSYTHDITLKAAKVASTGELFWSCVDLVKPSKGKRVYTKNWSWAAFSGRYGYPLLCESYSQRLVFAGTASQPLTLWMSRTDDIDNFMEGETDTSGIVLTVSAVSQDPICWIMSRKRDLLMGTSSAEYVINAVGGAAITSSNARCDVHSHRGSDGQTAVASDEKVVYVGRGGNRVFEYGYNYESDGYISRELSLLASHIGRYHGGMVRGSLSEYPETVVYFVLGDGQLALCTYNSMQEVRAWHRWVTDGKVLDVCVLPNGGGADLIFLIVERGGEKQIEVVREDGVYQDAGGRDYESKLVTNSLHAVVDKVVRKLPNTAFSLCFGEACDLLRGKIELSTDGGEHWYKVNSNLPELRKGWHADMLAWSANTFDRKFGMRVSGERGMNLLAIQA